MLADRLLFAGAGILILGLCFWMIRAGRYPSRGDWVTRKYNPIAFWSVTVASVIAGAVSLVLALLAF
jgi:hypothetical protein